MKLYDNGVYNVTDKVTKFIIDYSYGLKGDTSIEEVMMHTSGLGA